uniref:hypothetical protein n=1 Tax=Amycolatopsis sp. CA-290885 TaxID=3239925 RepID=UPI003F491D00
MTLLYWISAGCVVAAVLAGKQRKVILPAALIVIGAFLFSITPVGGELIRQFMEAGNGISEAAGQ